MSPTLQLFHKLWTKAVGTPGYVKGEWIELHRLIEDLERRKKERRKS